MMIVIIEDIRAKFYRFQGWVLFEGQVSKGADVDSHFSVVG
jgi:hypothetical protein